MPYSPSTGVYTLPPVYLAIAGTVIVAVQHNTPLTDLQTAQNYERPVIAGGTGANTAVGARTNLGVPSSSTTPSYTAPTVDNQAVRWDGVAGAQQGSPLVIADAATGSATLTATNDGATGAVIATDHESATPAASDVIQTIRAVGEDSAGNDQTYAERQVVIVDPTTATEDARVDEYTVIAGTLAARTHTGAGFWMEGATGGDPGAGKINATGLYEGGVRAVGAPYAVLQDQKTSGIDGGTFTQGAWRTRDLNTEVRDVASMIALAANQFTPTVAGWVEWSAPANAVDSHKSRLFNVTDTTVAGVGTAERADNGAGQVVTSSVGGAPVVAGKAYRIEHQCGNTRNTIGFGVAAGFSEVEVYTRVLFWPTA